MLLPILALLLAALVNGARHEAGLPALTPNHALTVTASDHALFMAETTIFDHWGRTWQAPQDRTQAAGYRGGVGEAIAHSTHDHPRMVMTGFLDSPPHAAILLDGSYTEMGVAVAQAASGRVYWVVDVGVGGD